MKLSSHTRAFTLAELMIGVAITTLLFGAIFTASASLLRSYAAADDYFSSHMQQIRIIDYLARDVKRSFSVTTSTDLSSVTCIMPKYLVETGDTEAISNSGKHWHPAHAGPCRINELQQIGRRLSGTRPDPKRRRDDSTLASARFADGELHFRRCRQADHGQQYPGRHQDLKPRGLDESNPVEECNEHCHRREVFHHGRRGQNRVGRPDDTGLDESDAPGE